MGAIKDKKDLLQRLSQLESVQLDLGCGPSKYSAQAIGIDQSDSDCVDIVGDVFDVLARFPDQSVDSIHSAHFFEHVDDVSRLVNEVVRVLKQGAALRVVVPHFSNPYYYSDPTHRSFFGLYTFCYFADCTFLQRRVPQYGKAVRLDLLSVSLVFRSPRPFYGRYVVKRVFGWLVNLTTWTKEFYEEMLTGLLPCYEIIFTLQRK